MDLETKDMEQMLNKKKFQMPHTFIILYAIILAVAALSYIIPAGQYDRVLDPETGREIVDAATYHIVESNPTSIMGLFEAFPAGFVDAGWVVVLTFCVCGGFYVVNSTGVVPYFIKKLANKMKDKGVWIIPVLMMVFATIDCFIGMHELCMVYVPIILPLMLALGFDSMTALMTALFGSTIGFTSALANPFTTIIAQKICGLPLLSGWQYRLISLVVVAAIGIAFTMRYASKVKKNPELSPSYESDRKWHKELMSTNNEEIVLNGRQKAAGIVAVLMFAVMIFGVFQWGWDMPEIGGIFMGMAAICGVIAGMKGNEICDKFMEGSSQVLLGALAIGVARGVCVVMNNALITDTIIHGLANMVQSLPASVAAIGMLIVQTILNFLIPSGSGQAVVSMPIMAPLADIVGVTRQTAVLALQYGDGFSNVFWPTGTIMMACLAQAHVTYDKWIKTVIRLFGYWTLAAAVFLVIAQAINWGPF